MTIFREFTDPRLVAVYDTVNPFAADTEFYIQLAAQLSASSIIDIGCGTGLLTCELARRGHHMTGVDPSPAMLDVARSRPGGELVRWVEGDASRLDQSEVDLAIMTGHVAQVIVDDYSWRDTLATIHGALGPSGRVAFESRNPNARAWEAWTPEASRRRFDDATVGGIEVWQELLAVGDGRVSFEVHYLFASSGQEVVSTNELRFRNQDELSRSLVEAGFSIEELFGDWDRRPVDVSTRELIFIAARNDEFESP